MIRYRLLGAALAAAVIGTALAVPATAAPRNTTAHEVESADYTLGDNAFTVPGFRKKIELTGRVHHPKDLGNGPYPLVLFLHGQHATCEVNGRASMHWPCPGKPIPSYQGYDYLGEELASRGYVVVSISANGVNSGDSGRDDSGMRARGELVDRHVQLWRERTSREAKWHNAIDFTRVGTMGHSRGGEGVIYHALGKHEGYQLRAVLPLAPVDFNRRVLTDVPTATVLPYCDGDVADLQGTHYYDDARYARAGDQAGKHLVTVMGANHNFFNTVWSPGSGKVGSRDDWDGDPKAACSDPANRLTEQQQRQAGITYVAGFFRYYLGGEQALKGLWQGESSDAKAMVSYHAPAARRQDVNRLDGKARNKVSGLSSATACSTICVLRRGGWAQEPHAGLHMVKAKWTKPGGRIDTELDSHDLNGFSTLRLRVAQDFTDAANKAGAAQDLSVRFTDGAGHEASVPLTRQSHALAYPPQGVGGDLSSAHFLLQQVRIPLDEVSGIDRADVRTVSLVFDRTGSGSVGLSDLTLTN
ncbi:hypothetical protein GCM10010174_74880 [Kutzneria viridogrisea]|uniref:PET hydrolase/cutinase-like domain-containing protein n=1 Tax=Kutzneria viridogrisea TaxID=47990 RepID=A0ABR6BN01_9PSEU|nr:hypothetical protein [Kutzneria viridogrisea]